MSAALAALLACDAEGGATDPCAQCADDERCTNDVCEPACLPPSLPRFDVVPLGLELAVDAAIEVAVDDVPQPGVVFDRLGEMAVHARWKTRPEACSEDRTFVATYRVVDRLPDASAEGADDAVAIDDARIVAWATDVDATFGGEVDATWRDLGLALGPAAGVWNDVAALGNGGTMTFTFDVALSDGPGLDLAVFENAFAPTFLELAFVEVSSDGRRFARFPSLSVQTEPVAAYGALDASEVSGVAGRYAGLGVGFDLALLADTAAVATGQVDLADIRYVRVVDIVGDGSALDSRGHVVYDPTPTFGSAGFDVDAVAVLGTP